MIVWLVLEGLLSKKWKDYYFVLFNDSTLQWFEKQSDRKPEGSIVIRNVAQNLCVGPYTRCLPSRPSFPRPTDEANIIALPRSTPGHHGQEIVWILCNDVTHLKWAMLWDRSCRDLTGLRCTFSDWMKAIVSTVSLLDRHGTMIEWVLLGLVASTTTTSSTIWTTGWCYATICSPTVGSTSS